MRHFKDFQTNNNTNKLRNTIILFSILIIQVKAVGQINQEDKLIKAFIQYKMTDEYTDSLRFKQNLLKLNVAIENAIENKNILNYKFFKKTADSFNVNYEIRKSENNNLLFFTMSDNFFHWNYIVDHKKVILKDHKLHEYYTEIHNLNKNEFLLIEQRDDLVFACNYAYVFQKKGNSFKKKKAFGNKIKLTVCNFTQIENSTPEKLDHFSLPTRKISFDYKNKIIFYGSCTNSITGKNSIGKVKYINGNFKIKDCDERKDFD
jgi:hypothetical protein